MEGLEASGKSVDEAIAQGLARLGLERDQVDQVEVEILHQGRSGILGIGAEDARVRVTPKLMPTVAAPQEAGELAKQILEGLLQAMGVNASVQVVAGDDPSEERPRLNLSVSGDDMGILIGRRGETLGALQYIVNLMVGRRIKMQAAVQVDVEGYRARRAAALARLATHMADRARATGQSVILEPMPPAERRLVHLALHDSAYVTTQSIGDGDERKVVITPRPSREGLRPRPPRRP